MEVPPCCNNALLHKGISLARSYVFHWLAFLFDGRAREFTRRCKTTSSHQSKKKKQIGPIGRPNLFTAFSNPCEPPLYPTRSHLLWITMLQVFTNITKFFGLAWFSIIIHCEWKNDIQYYKNFTVIFKTSPNLYIENHQRGQLKYIKDYVSLWCCIQIYSLEIRQSSI